MINDHKSHGVLKVHSANKITDCKKISFTKNQEGLEESMKGSEFIPDSVDLLHYQLHKTSLKSVRSYIDSLKWLKNKKATINPKIMIIIAFNML